MRYVTHAFAHPETLERARRWLIQAGIDPSRIEAHTQGIPRLAVAVEPGEAAEVALLIDAAESGDPDGFPSFFDLAQRRHIYPQAMQSNEPLAREARSSSFVLGWRPVDTALEVTQETTDVDVQRAYREHWGQNF